MTDSSNVIAFPTRTPRAARGITAAISAAPLSETQRELVLTAVLRGIAALGLGYSLAYDSREMKRALSPRP
jgi:hypothetical protein